MSETSSNKPTRKSSNFDWGPPSNATSESIKEWLVYFILLVMLGLGTWALLDSRIIAPSVSSTFNRSSKTLSKTVKQPAKNYYVQLSAFAEEKDAKDTYQKLVQLGYFPVLHEPDNDYEIYRIELGPYNNELDANTLVEKLNSLEFSCFVVESQ